MPIFRRIGLWILPLGLALGLGWTLRVSEARADLAAAQERLVAGDIGAAARLLTSPLETPDTRRMARLGLATVAALSGQGSAGFLTADGHLPALTPLARRELDAGRFDAAFRLAELSHRLGRPVDAWLEAAIRIEVGRAEGLVLPASDPGTGVLERRVRDWLSTASPTRGTLLRDRSGRRIGWVSPERTLQLADDVETGWVPPALLATTPVGDAPHALRSTLDVELARLALESLGRFRGSIVLLDPGTGEILAAVSDRRTLEREGGTPAFEQYREPASISKILTTAAYLRAGKDPDAEISTMRCRGHERYDGEFLYCPYIAGRLRGLDRALAVSCNVAFANLGVELGRDAMLDELRRWGFENPLGRFQGGAISPPRDDRDLADVSIGLDLTDLTPLHAALIAATVANDGVRPTPHLIAADDSLLGLSLRPRAVPGGTHVLEPEWLPALRGAMESVVDRGTARGLAPGTFPVAMKTGTASHPDHGFHVNYVGYGPRADARIAFAVRITHQGTSRQVRYVAKLVTGRLLRHLGRIAEDRGWGVRNPPSPTVTTPPGVRLAESAYQAPTPTRRAREAPSETGARTSRAVMTAPR